MELLAIPPYLALNKYLIQFDDFATQVNQADTDDNHGMSHILYSAPEFLAIKGTVPIVPVDPGDYTAIMVGGLLEAHKERKGKYHRFRVGAVFLGNAFEAGLSAHFKELLVVNHSLNHQTTAEQIAQLKLLVIKKKDDLVFLRQQISKPFVAPARIETHVRQQLENIAHLARAGQPLAPELAISSMLLSFEATENDRQDFQLARTQFLQEHGDEDQQTPEVFAEFISKFVNQRLPNHRANQSVMRAANVATLAANAAILAAADAAIVTLHAAAAASVNIVKNKNKSTTQGAPRTDPKYCWSCGPLKGHYSKGCWQKTRKPGHQDAATEANRMGGKS